MFRFSSLISPPLSRSWCLFLFLFFTVKVSSFFLEYWTGLFPSSISLPRPDSRFRPFFFVSFSQNFFLPLNVSSSFVVAVTGFFPYYVTLLNGIWLGGNLGFNLGAFNLVHARELDLSVLFPILPPCGSNSLVNYPGSLPNLILLPIPHITSPAAMPLLLATQSSGRAVGMPGQADQPLLSGCLLLSFPPASLPGLSLSCHSKMSQTPKSRTFSSVSWISALLFLISLIQTRTPLRKI